MISTNHMHLSSVELKIANPENGRVFRTVGLPNFNGNMDLSKFMELADIFHSMDRGIASALIGGRG